jgi:hypothetical protein
MNLAFKLSIYLYPRDTSAMVSHLSAPQVAAAVAPAFNHQAGLAASFGVAHG